MRGSRPGPSCSTPPSSGIQASDVTTQTRGPVIQFSVQNPVIGPGGLGCVVSDRNAGCDSKAAGLCLGWLGQLGKPGQYAAKTSGLTDLLRCAAAGAVVIASVGAATVAGTGPAAASTVHRTLQFTCSSSYGIAVAMTGLIEADVPDSAVAGKPVPGIVFKATATVDSYVVTNALHWLGVTSVQGKAWAALTAQGRTLSVPLTIVNALVPASGPTMTAVAAGSTPPFAFMHPGAVKIVLDRLTAKVTPMRSDGTVAASPAEATCVLDPRQSNVLDTITVAPADASTSPTPSVQPPAGPSTSTYGTSEGPTAPTPTVSSGSTSSTAGATSGGPTAPTPTVSGSGSATSTTGTTSGVPGPKPSPGPRSSWAPLLAVLGALVGCGAAIGTFLWFRRRPGRRGDSGG